MLSLHKVINFLKNQFQGCVGWGNARLFTKWPQGGTMLADSWKYPLFKKNNIAWIMGVLNLRLPKENCPAKCDHCVEFLLPETSAYSSSHSSKNTLNWSRSLQCILHKSVETILLSEKVSEPYEQVTKPSKDRMLLILTCFQYKCLSFFLGR